VAPLHAPPIAEQNGEVECSLRVPGIRRLTEALHPLGQLPPRVDSFRYEEVVPQQHKRGYVSLRRSLAIPRLALLMRIASIRLVKRLGVMMGNFARVRELRVRVTELGGSLSPGADTRPLSAQRKHSLWDILGGFGNKNGSG